MQRINGGVRVPWKPGIGNSPGRTRAGNQTALTNAEQFERPVGETVTTSERRLPRRDRDAPSSDGRDATPMGVRARFWPLTVRPQGREGASSGRHRIRRRRRPTRSGIDGAHRPRGLPGRGEAKPRRGRRNRPTRRGIPSSEIFGARGRNPRSEQPLDAQTACYDGGVSESFACRFDWPKSIVRAGLRRASPEAESAVLSPPARGLVVGNAGFSADNGSAASRRVESQRQSSRVDGDFSPDSGCRVAGTAPPNMNPPEIQRSRRFGMRVERICIATAICAFSIGAPHPATAAQGPDGAPTDAQVVAAVAGRGSSAGNRKGPRGSLDHSASGRGASGHDGGHVRDGACGSGGRGRGRISR